MYFDNKVCATTFIFGIIAYTVIVISNINGFDVPIADNGQSTVTTVNLTKVSHDILKVYRESEESKGKTVVAVVGDTGCGISTFINYLAGCKMTLIKREEIYRKFMASVVVDVAEDSQIPSVAPVGHLGQSKTSRPESVTLNDTVFLDTPGYLDSRGLDFRISNAVNLRQVLHKASEVKIVLLLQLASLHTGRGEALKNLIRTLCNFFGSQDVLQKHIDSILVVVTKIGRPTEDEQIPLEELQNDVSYLLEAKFKSLKFLSQRLVLYDPLDRDDRQYTPTMKREKILDEIRKMKSIKNPSKVFLTSFNTEELDALLDAEDRVIEKVLESLESGNVAEASKYFQVMKVLQSIVRNDKVSERIEVIRKIVSNVMRQLNGWIRQLTPEQRELLEHVGELFDDNEPFDEEKLDILEKKCENVSQFKTQFTKAVKLVLDGLLTAAEKFVVQYGVPVESAKAVRDAAEKIIDSADEMWHHV